MKNTNYIVVEDQHTGWSILNAVTGEIVEGGFFSQTAAKEWITWWYRTPVDRLN